MKKLIILMATLTFAMSNLLANDFTEFKNAWSLENKAENIEAIDLAASKIEKEQLKTGLQAKSLRIKLENQELKDQAWIDLKQLYLNNSNSYTYSMIFQGWNKMGGTYDQQISYYQSHVDNEQKAIFNSLRRLLHLYGSKNDAVNVKKCFKELIEIQKRPVGLTFHMSYLNKSLPDDNVLRLFVSDADEALKSLRDKYRKEGRVNEENLTNIIDQLDKGGELRPFKVDQDLTTWIDGLDPNTVDRQFYIDLFKGNFDKAFVYAFNKTKTIKTNIHFKMWVDMAHRCLRCHYQNYNQEPLQYLKWVKGEIEINPVQNLIDQNNE